MSNNKEKENIKTLPRGMTELGPVRRRRLTLAPGMLSPPACRFNVLDGIEDEPDEDQALVAAEGTATRAAAEVLEEDRRAVSPVVRRPPKSNEELAQEFWEDAGFPTPASRFWERSSSPTDSDNAGMSFTSVCRTPSTVGDVSLEEGSSMKEARGGRPSSS